jgi:hypothetical protein
MSRSLSATDDQTRTFGAQSHHVRFAPDDRTPSAWPVHAAVLEPQGTAGTTAFVSDYFPPAFVGLIFMQAME